MDEDLKIGFDIIQSLKKIDNIEQSFEMLLDILSSGVVAYRQTSGIDKRAEILEKLKVIFEEYD